MYPRPPIVKRKLDARPSMRDDHLVRLIMLVSRLPSMIYWPLTL